MSWRDAPLYVEANDLAVWLMARLSKGSIPASRLRRRIEEAACELPSRVSLALTFPATRKHQLRRTDETIVRLRSDLRLANSSGL